MKYWLVKSEEDLYPIEQLESDGATPWDGIRNYEARNFMRDAMKPGDLVLYYHSNATPTGVVGIASVAGLPYPDPLQFDSSSRYHDPKSDPSDPRWILVDLAFEERFPRKVTLAEIRKEPRLANMTLLKRMRLSVQPVQKQEFDLICRMASRAG